MKLIKLPFKKYDGRSDSDETGIVEINPEHISSIAEHETMVTIKKKIKVCHISMGGQATYEIRLSREELQKKLDGK